MSDDPTAKSEPTAEIADGAKLARVKKPKKLSRPQRWAAAVSAAQSALENVRTANADLTTALEDLRSIQEEYQEWRDNLPENLQNGTLGEKLEAVAELDVEGVSENVETACSEVEEVISEAESAELPQGFGRD